MTKDFKRKAAAILGIEATLIEHVIDHSDAQGKITAFEPFWHDIGADGKRMHRSRRLDVSQYPELLTARRMPTLTFDAWYLQVENLSNGRVLGERLNLRPYFERGLAPVAALKGYLGE